MNCVEAMSNISALSSSVILRASLFFGLFVSAGLSESPRSRGAVVLAEPVRFLDAAPAEVVQHPFGYVVEKVAVGVADEVQDGAPFPFAVVGLQSALGLRGPLQNLVQHETAQPVGYRLEQSHLLLEEGAFLLLRRGLYVKDVDLAGLLFVDEDVGLLHALGFPEVGGLVDVGADDDPRAAVVGVLPSGRDRPGDIHADLVQFGVMLLQYLFDAVKALELLLPFPEEAEHVVVVRFLIHGISPPGRSCRPP